MLTWTNLVQRILVLISTKAKNTSVKTVKALAELAALYPEPRNVVRRKVHLEPRGGALQEPREARRHLGRQPAGRKPGRVLRVARALEREHERAERRARGADDAVDGRPVDAVELERVAAAHVPAPAVAVRVAGVLGECHPRDGLEDGLDEPRLQLERRERRRRERREQRRDPGLGAGAFPDGQPCDGEPAKTGVAREVERARHKVCVHAC
jgi:hypothetical protein